MIIGNKLSPILSKIGLTIITLLGIQLTLSFILGDYKLDFKDLKGLTLLFNPILSMIFLEVYDKQSKKKIIK